MNEAGETLRQLADWEPPHGVISVAFDAPPGDRSARWRIGLRDRLRELSERAHAADDRARRQAVDATVRRVLSRFPDDAPPPDGRAQIGYVEVSADGAQERWFGLQIPLAEFGVTYSRRADLRPLAEVLDEGRPFAIAAISAERVRLLDWSLGRIEEVTAYDLETFELDWRERKGPTMSGPARHTTTSSGRDQFGQRLEHNRERFLAEAGHLARGPIAKRHRDAVLCLGDRAHCQRFSQELRHNFEVTTLDHADVISQPARAIGERVQAALPALNRDRRLSLVTRAVDAAAAGGSGALGLQENVQALSEGRVEHLLFDADRDYDLHTELAGVEIDGDRAVDEWMVEQAIRTRASVTPLRDEVAAALDPHEGVAAILRY